MIKNSWKEKGFVDDPIEEGVDVVAEIRRLKSEKNAIILAHYYTDGSLQDVADFVGDSLALARKAATTDADIIVMCGVHFMAETCKLLCPEKLVLLPDLNALCSLAESCPYDEFKSFIEAHPDHKVLSYVNTTAAIKSLTDVVVTSGNACEIVDSFPKDEKIIFGPDKNLGHFINEKTGRNMLLWHGACHVHDRFSIENLKYLKKRYPEAKVLAHAECKDELLKLADVVGSTAALLNFVRKNDSIKSFIVATEPGIIHQMEKISKSQEFIPVPPNDNYCCFNECNYMRLNTLNKVYNSLKNEWPSIEIDADIKDKALKPIDSMLKLSEQLGL